MLATLSHWRQAYARHLFNAFETIKSAPGDVMSEGDYPVFEDVYLFALSVIAIALIRPILEQYVFRPIAVYRIRRVWKHIKKDLTDENGKPTDIKTDNILFERQVVRFCESGFKFLYYLLSTVVGLYIVLNASFLTDSHEFFRNWPFHPLENIKYYYILGIGYYTYLIFKLQTDVRRKDHYEMLIHHIVTSTLILISYLWRFYRAGVTVLLLHDNNDVFLELAKMFRYAKMPRAQDISFGFFAFAWFITRKILFPRVIYGVLVPLFDYVLEPPFFWWMLFAYMLCLLLVLNIYWGLLIIRVAYNALTSNDYDDVRSDDDE